MSIKMNCFRESNKIRDARRRKALTEAGLMIDGKGLSMSRRYLLGG